jgi:tRNA (guanine-N(7)-)-methyltransferase subunit TRM82
MGNLSHYQTLTLDGNPLAMDTNDSTKTLIVSIDSVCKPGSTSQIRSEGGKAVEPLQAIQLAGGRWSGSAFHFKPSSAVVDVGGQGRESWPGLLYNLGNLRKRAGEE